jgi:broad specificity phosphatase PhoE
MLNSPNKLKLVALIGLAVGLLIRVFYSFLFAAPAAIDVHSGNIILIRHANAPGTGDPSEFRLNDCSTQRNLDDAGKAQAKQIGLALKNKGVQITAVWSSQWCRCKETADLAFGATLKVQEQPSFNSFFGNSQAATPQTALAKNQLARWRGPGTLVVVTHQVNITGLSGQWVNPGQAMLFTNKRGQLKLVGPLGDLHQ